jgi:CubicO group peptidase (beta-lactamase class C family)
MPESCCIAHANAGPMPLRGAPPERANGWGCERNAAKDRVFTWADPHASHGLTIRLRLRRRRRRRLRACAGGDADQQRGDQKPAAWRHNRCHISESERIVQRQTGMRDILCPSTLFVNESSRHLNVQHRRWRRAAATGVALCIAAGCAGRTPPPITPNPHAHEAIGSVTEMYDGRLTPALAASTFRNIDRLFPTRVVARGRRVTPLPVAAQQLGGLSFMSAGAHYTLDDYVIRNRVAGLLVIKRGRIVHERYALGATPQSRWMSMSIAKSITSTLIGAAIQDGVIRSIDDSVTKYVPALRGSAYDGVTVRQILMMASGVRWTETYTDSTSDRRKLLAAQIAQRPGAALALMASLPNAATPGTQFNYSTGETLVAGAIVRGATGKTLAAYLSEKIWQPAGMESHATWWLDSPDGHEIGGSGLSATLRDFGRFGLFALRDGRVQGTPMLPAGWMAVASAPTLPPSARNSPYGYMWWPMTTAAPSVHAGAYAAQGIFGQWIYINPREELVIVQLGAQTHPSAGEVIKTEDVFAAIAEAVAE